MLPLPGGCTSVRLRFFHQEILFTRADLRPLRCLLRGPARGQPLLSPSRTLCILPSSFGALCPHQASAQIGPSCRKPWQPYLHGTTPRLSSQSLNPCPQPWLLTTDFTLAYPSPSAPLTLPFLQESVRGNFQDHIMSTILFLLFKPPLMMVTFKAGTLHHHTRTLWKRQHLSLCGIKWTQKGHR